MMNNTRKSSKPLEGTWLLRRPMPAGSAGGQAVHTYAFPSCHLLPGLHSQSVPGRPEFWHSSQGASSLASPYLLASRFYRFLHSPCGWATMATCHPLNPPTLPLITQCHSSDVHSASNPCFSLAPGEFHTALRPPTLQGLLWSKSNRLISVPLTFTRTQGYQTLGVYLFILQNRNPALSPVNSSSAESMSYWSCKWKTGVIKASQQ